ncbi:MAG: type II toxin-antitoxin system VapC family toxin [Promethearchaeota archaeon]
MIILDTNVIIEIIHNRLNFEKLKLKVPETEVFGISTISLYELYFGLYQLKFDKAITLNQAKWDVEIQSIRLIEEKLEIFPFNSKSADFSAELFNRLRFQGKMIEIFDCMIAGIMNAFDIKKIITTNIKHFKLIPGLEIIEI